MINYFVPGKPIPQCRPRVTKFGGVYETKNVKEWKKHIKLHCVPKFDPIDYPIDVYLSFIMPRPKSHYNSKGLKKNAPYHHVKRPDIDNLQKAVFDALVDNGVFKDDSYICSSTTHKMYENEQYCQGVYILIRKASNK